LYKGVPIFWILNNTTLPNCVKQAGMLSKEIMLVKKYTCEIQKNFGA